MRKDYYEKLWNVNSLNQDVWSPCIRKDSDEEVEAFLNYLTQNKITGRVLDLGCGGGRHSVLFAKKGFEVTGFDISKNAIKLAKEWMKKIKLNITFNVGSVLTYRDQEKYHILLDYGCLHHIPKKDWIRYTRTILSECKVGAYFFLYAFSNKTKSWCDKKLTKNYIICNGEYSHFFTLNELKSIFNNFEIIYSKEKFTPDKQSASYILYLRRIR